MPQIKFRRAYFCIGGGAKRDKSDGRASYELTGTPYSGFGNVFMIFPDTPEGGTKKRAATCTILFPHSLDSFTVTTRAAEVVGSVDVPLDRVVLSRIIRQTWDTCNHFGWQKSFDVAAIVLMHLGEEVPTRLARAEAEGSQPQRKGGKPLMIKALVPVKPGGKRAAVAEIFQGREPVSLLEAMARLGMNRNTLLTHLHRLHTEHGVGYELVGDCARLDYPADHKLIAE